MDWDMDKGEVMAKLLACAKGSYQIDLILGAARWSGADLRGRARRWGARYYHSRRNLIARMRAAVPGVAVLPIGAHRRLVLTLNGAAL